MKHTCNMKMTGGLDINEREPTAPEVTVCQAMPGVHHVKNGCNATESIQCLMRHSDKHITVC